MNGRLVARDALTPAERAEMLALLATHFAGVVAEQFDADLAGKNWAILLEDDAGRLVGFSTLLLYRREQGGEPITVLYSGDTIVDPRGWGSSALPRTWIDSVLRLHRAYGRGRLVWMLITSGYRTYRFLPVFWRAFFPRCDTAMPETVKTLRDHLAQDRFGAGYDPRTGVVRLALPQVLRPRLQGIPEARLRDPHVAYFVKANPGHTHGDELVCLTEICDANLTPAGRRMVRGGDTSSLRAGRQSEALNP